jgi:H+/gluconate symporter-like permease
VGLAGILIGLAFLVGLAYRGWSILLLAPLAALIATVSSGEPILAHWTQTFMGSASLFLAQFFPIFLLGALFGKLMEDSGSVSVIAETMRARLGERRAIVAVVLAGAIVTYGGVSLFVAFFVLAPMAQAAFRAAHIPRRLIPATIVLGTATFTMSALPGTPSIQNAIPMPFFGTTPFAAPGLGVIASAIMLGFGLWWLRREERTALALNEGFGSGADLHASRLIDDDALRQRATTAREFDPAELAHGRMAADRPSPVLAIAPLIVVIAVNLMMSLAVLPSLNFAFLAEERFGRIPLSAVSGVWSVVTALVCAIVVVLAINHRRLTALRETVDAGATASVLPALSVASLVGFGAVVAAMPAFESVREAVLGIGGGPLVSLAVSTNLLAALTGSASGGLTIALDALGSTYLARAADIGLDPGVLHRVAVIGAGSLDLLPHNGAVVSLLAVCGSTHGESYRDIIMTGIVGAVLALAAVIALGTTFGSF